MSEFSWCEQNGDCDPLEFIDALVIDSASLTPERSGQDHAELMRRGDNLGDSPHLDSAALGPQLQQTLNGDTQNGSS